MSIAGAVTYLQLSHTSNAADRDRARVNQDTSYRRAAPKYTTGSGTVTVAPNDTVLVEPGHTAGGYVGSIYQYTGTQDQSLDLADVDFTGPNWQMVSQQDVIVLGDSENDSINVGGNYQTIGFSNLGKTSENFKIVVDQDVGDQPGLISWARAPITPRGRSG